MVWGIFKSDAVSETYKKMKAEELKGNQHKLDVDKDGKIEGEDLAKLRAQKEKENSMKYGKDVKESAENVEEGWDDMVKYAKEKNAPQPNGGAGKKQGTRYGGSKQKDEKEVKEDVEQIDEISKKTLGSYVSKASVDMANRTADATKKKTLAGADYAHNISRGMDAKTADKHMKKDYEDAKPDVNKAVKRMHNINKAVSRLTKEETEQVEEKMDMAKADMGDVIKDFEKSDAPQFAGKSKEKRRQMAVAAKLGAEREAGMREDLEMPSFADFLKEYEAKDGVYRHKGSYGSSYQGDSDDEDAPKKPAAPAVKRGRGRPVGSKSGARTAGSSTGKKSGVDYSGYPLHLPNKK
jgi:hypothetical protein